MLLRTGILTGLAAGALFAPTLVSATERLVVTSNTDARLTGTDTRSGLRFSVSLSRDKRVVTVILELLPTRVIAKVDDARKTAVIRSVSAVDGRLTQLNHDEVQALHDFAGVLDDPTLATKGPIRNYLRRVLLLLLSYPPGTPIDLDIGPEPEPKPPPGGAPPLPPRSRPGGSWTSICDKIGASVTASYDINEGETISTDVVVGPCADGACLGRCGPNCGPLPLSRIQVFTQECLNHDQCCADTDPGTLCAFNECSDEWWAAADGFLFAPDCAAITGDWFLTVQYGTYFQGSTDGGSWSGVLRFSDWGDGPDARLNPFENPATRETFIGFNAWDHYWGQRSALTAVNGRWRYSMFMDSDTCGWQQLPDAWGRFSGTNVCGRFNLDFTGSWPWYYTGECSFAGFGDGAGQVEGVKITPGFSLAAQTQEGQGEPVCREAPGGLRAGTPPR